jgi:hypothetical protein
LILNVSRNFVVLHHTAAQSSRGYRILQAMST